ncbi:MAG: FAD:protein FMN transferase [Aliivibrio sp.]|uniref:FAD:protein FMN transferase n=1 Tax=Aliivibrio sp. TaxID=1872443 RepID=UPI001A47235C|nr:FAD:protein FMN transferase [Aliivibrio sp.]
MITHLKQKIQQLVTAFIVIFLLSACSQPQQEVQLSGRTMGTTYSVKYLQKEGIVDSAKVQTEIDRLLELVNDQMSTYRKTSELSQFNQQTTLQPFTVSLDTATVIAEAIRLSELTGGALDVTVGPLVNLWGFGPEARQDVVPSDTELEARRAIIGIEHLSLNDTQLTKDIPELYVDLSTIAKGWGVDKVAEYLQQLGSEDYLVEIGGELRLKGKNKEGVAWRVAIEKPSTDERTIQEIIEPGDMGLATSGDYRNYFERDGIRYSHIINPETGKPINHKVVSVSVLDPSCMTADGLATGFMVLGAEQALELANRENIPMFMVIKTDDGFEEIVSEAFKPYLKR